MSVRAVVIAHREALAAEGIAAALSAYPALVTVGVATNARELELCAVGADVAAVDARIPGASRSVTKLQRRGLRVVVMDEPVSADLDDAAGLRIAMSASMSSLAAALVPGARPAAARLAVLTQREREVLQLAAKGMAGKQIARALGISHKTVEQHKTRTFRKLGVPNQAAAVGLWSERGRS